jgi:hypothetical protein
MEDAASSSRSRQHQRRRCRHRSCLPAPNARTERSLRPLVCSAASRSCALRPCRVAQRRAAAHRRVRSGTAQRIIAASGEHGETGPACACMLRLADARRMHLSMWARAEAGSAPVQRTRKRPGTCESRLQRRASARGQRSRDGKSVASAPDERAPRATRPPPCMLVLASSSRVARSAQERERAGVRARMRRSAATATRLGEGRWRRGSLMQRRGRPRGPKQPHEGSAQRAL